MKLSEKASVTRKLLSAGSDATSTPDSAIAEVLDLLVGIGFESSRYYDSTFDVPSNEEVVILSAASRGPVDRIGHTIPLRYAGLGDAHKTGIPVRGTGDSPALSEHQRKWVTALNLVEKEWVDLPLRSGDSLVGLISCSWPARTLEINQDDIVVLELIASRLAGTLVTARKHAAESACSRLAAVVGSQQEPLELMEHALQEIATSVGAAAAAVFEHRWITDSLVKIHEYTEPTLRGRTTELVEVYHSHEEALTRRAWAEARYRHIVDFAELSKKLPGLVATPSYDRHTTLLGKLKTAMYAVVGGDAERRFLIRLINRCGNSELPFSTSDRALFETIGDELTVAIDNLVTGRRLRRFQQVAASLVEKTGNRDDVFTVIRGALAEEDIGSFAVLAHSEGSSYLNVERYFGPLFKDWKASEHKPEAWDADAFYAGCVNKSTHFQTRLTTMQDHTDQTKLVGYLHSKGTPGVLCMPVAAGRTRGVVVVPYPPNGHTGSTLPKASRARLDTLRTYSTLIASCIEAMDSQATVERARHLVGHIGHEVNTPAAILGQKALEAVVVARHAIPSGDVEMRRRLTECYNAVESAMRNMGQTMEVAGMVAQENKGSLQLYFRRNAINEVLQEARESLAGELAVRRPDGTTNRFRINIGPSCERLGDLVCDGDLLKQVFVNLFRNGLKYSLPRYPSEPMIVDVIGMRQTGMTTISVTNWGLGIPEEDFERVFRPFTRGSIHDRLKAIRGMGLGLYISRRIVAAHEGTVFCHHSTFTLANPRKREVWEGFETRFEVRIPHSLSEGIRDHVWEREL